MFPHFSKPLQPSEAAIAHAHSLGVTKKPAEGLRMDASLAANDPHASKVIIRLPKLKHLLGVSRSTVYLRLNAKSKYYDPLFPKPIRLGAKAVGWLLADVYAYIDHLRKADEVAI